MAETVAAAAVPAAPPEQNGAGMAAPALPGLTGTDRAVAVAGLLFGVLIILVSIDLLAGGRLSRFGGRGEDAPDA